MGQLNPIADPLRQPGSPLAMLDGCTCDPIANHHGTGARLRDGHTEWWPDLDCPLHGIAQAVITPATVFYEFSADDEKGRR